MKAIYQGGKLLFLYAGLVEKDVRFFTKEGIRSAVVTLKDRSGDTIDIFFKNNEKGNLADRIEKANVKQGSYLSILAAGEKEAKTASGLDFKYSGIWIFKGKDGQKDTTVLHGCACSPREPKEDIFTVSMPVKTLKGGNEETIWYEIAFYNSADGKYHNADTAKKLLSEKAQCCIRGGEIKEKVVKGKTYYNITGFGIDMKPYED